MLSKFAIKSRRNRKAFTLIELLVVVLILAILMAVALPLYLSAVADSQLKTCRSNMQTIATAVQAARVKSVAADYGAYTGKTVTQLVADSKLPDLLGVPACPVDGSAAYAIVDAGATVPNPYGAAVTVPAGSFGVTCTSGAGTLHGGYIPGSMSK